MDPLKKITISRSNNSAFFMVDTGWITDALNAQYLTELKTYIDDYGFKPVGKNETELILECLRWVASQWQHDGVNAPAAGSSALDILKSVHQDGQRYRCVEYGKVLADLLQCFGFPTRSVMLRSVDVAYGKFGSGHVAMEVWVNDLEKWIFLDPQFGAYLSDAASSVPLNFYELFKSKANGEWDRLKISSMIESFESTSYKEFLSHYFGHMTVSGGKGNPGVCLLLEGTEVPLTFQGLPIETDLLVKDHTRIYPEMNRVSIVLSYLKKTNFHDVMRELKIDMEEVFQKHMAKLAPEPRFKVSLKTAFKVAGFEYRHRENGEWISSKGPEFNWDAIDHGNLLEVRAINEFGRRGPITFIEIKYE